MQPRLVTSDNLLLSIQEKIKWADAMSELDKKHRKDLEEKTEEVKKSLSFKVSNSVLHFSLQISTMGGPVFGHALLCLK